MNTLIESLLHLTCDDNLARNIAIALLAAAIFLIELASVLILERYLDPLKRRLDTLKPLTMRATSATKRFIEN